MSTTQKTAPPAAAPESARRVDGLRRFLAGEGFVLALVVVYVLAVSPFANGLLTERNAVNVLSNLWPLAIIVIGQSFVLILGGIDLSQTAVISVANTFGALFIAQAFAPALFSDTVFWGSVIGEEGGALSDAGLGGTVLAIVLTVVAGCLIGLLNGCAVAVLRMPPFMVTLGTMLLFGAVAIWMTRSENVTSLPPEYLAIGSTQGGGVASFLTLSMGVAVVVAIGAHYVLSRTTYGAWLYAAGTSRRTAVVSGVPHTRMVISAYVISAGLAALGSVLYSSRLGAGRPTLGDDMLLDVIGAAIIGGISLFGGKGSVLGAFLGALFFVILSNSLNLMNLPFHVVWVVKGLVIVAAALLDVGRNRLIGGRR